MPAAGSMYSLTTRSQAMVTMFIPIASPESKRKRRNTVEPKA